MKKYGAPGDGKIRDVLSVTKPPVFGEVSETATPSTTEAASAEKKESKEKV